MIDIIRAMWYNSIMDTIRDIERMSVTRLKRDTADLLNRVSYTKERFVITSSGKERAALVSVSDLEQLLRLPQDEENDEQSGKRP